MKHARSLFYRIADLRKQKVVKRTWTLNAARKWAYGSEGYDFVIINRNGEERTDYR